MMIVRPVQENDLEHIFNLAKHAGIGVTTLLADRDILAKKIDLSMQTFLQKATHPLYFFVLEDTDQKRVVGTSVIDASVDGELPFYSYKLSTIVHISHELNIHQKYHVLYLNNDYQGKTELSTLFLSPAYRKHGNGTLLSRARFLFMAQFPQLFTDVVIAELRGVSDLKGQSPFWQSMGQHFFNMDFDEADRLTSITNKRFISDLMPQCPIYVNLLSQAAQATIGNPHQDTKPAFAILGKEGFVYRGYIDIFDAGPIVEAQLQHIRTIRESELLHVNNIVERISAPKKYLIANINTGFRACLAELEVLQNERINITSHVAEVLNMKVGSEVRVVQF